MFDNKLELGHAIELFKILMEGQEVSKIKNKDLYTLYIYNQDVQEYFEYVLGILDMEVYVYHEKLFITPGVENRLFGYSNSELKSKINYIKKNDELYLCYFVMMTIITMFYIQSGSDTMIDYIKHSEIVERVSEKFKALIDQGDLEHVSIEYNFNFVTVAKEWDLLPTTKEDNTLMGKKDKLSFVNNVCKFLEDEGLLKFDSDRNIIIPTDKFKAIIFGYFENRSNKSRIFEFINNLKKEELYATNQ